jgi:hypothetical protein
MPIIELTAQFLCHNGAQYNPGERVMVDDDLARHAVNLGCARLIEPVVEDAKRLAESPAHKQMRRAPALK